MTPRVATVLSSRDWESRLVAHARETAALKLVLRAYRPDEVEGRLSELDAVVAGAETSWVTPARIGSWRRHGLRVIGIHPVGDRPARQRLWTAGADDVLADDTPTEAIARAVRLLEPPTPPGEAGPGGRITAVVGARGAPGRTEIALSLAATLATRERTVLIDLDLEAPAVAIRLGLPPRPDVVDASDAVHADGELAADAIRQWRDLAVIVASHRDGISLKREAIADLLVAASGGFDHVVVDAGREHDPVGADGIVLVVEGTPTGIVRATHLTASWHGPTPVLVLNRVPRDQASDVVTAVRHWTGLEPAAVILEDARIRDRARRSAAPARSLQRVAQRIAAAG